MAERKQDRLRARDAERDLGAELLQSVREMKQGRVARRTDVDIPEVALVRHEAGLSQAEFAQLLGISRRTLQEWEQGRREPSGAARTLIVIARRHPEWLRELAA